MKQAEFQAYRRASIARFQRILDVHGKGHDQGLPSYTNANPLMSRLIWKRVELILQFISDQAPLKNVLDFGCGYGVFIPFLMPRAETIIAYDLMVDDLRIVGQEAGWQNIVYETDLSRIALMSNSFDLILATEVLEHIDDLDDTLRLFSEILTPGGSLLVSGPTENVLYRFGRKLVGYKGDYHVRNIYDIRELLEKRFSVNKVATVISGLPFYEIYQCTRPK